MDRDEGRGSDMGEASRRAELRAQIMEDPEAVLEDRAVMEALIAANEKALGENIVDLRGIAMARLESRLERLEDTHRSVIAAAYENLAGTNQIHRAILALLDPMDFVDFLEGLGSEVAGILRVDCIRMVLELRTGEAAEPPHEVLALVPPGHIDRFVGGREGAPARAVTLRRAGLRAPEIYGDFADEVRSEALMRLDFGPGRQPGLLVFGSADREQFKPSQGTDLLAFFAGVFERQMRRWLG